jgi:hypothetical protein
MLRSVGRLATVAILGTLGGSAVACSDSCGNVNCSGGGTLYVHLVEAVPAGTTLEVCFEDACGGAELDPAHRATGYVPEGSLGTWTDHRDDELTVALRAADGRELGRETLAADQEDGECCDDYWIVRTTLPEASDR